MLSKITLNLELSDINLILTALSKLPYEVVYTLIPKVQNQAIEQSKGDESNVPS